MSRLRDTIAAIATPPGRGGIGVVRLSGPLAPAIAAQLLDLTQPLTPRHATFAHLHDSAGHTIDHVVATQFAGPRSYTGEDVVEISCHGSPAVLRHCVERAVQLGARPAEPGEFTLRAFANGRIDLTQAEAIRDLIESQTLYQARVAAQQAEGSVSRRLAPLKAQLLELIALLEAGIDFADNDIDVAPASELLRRLDALEAELNVLTASFERGRLVQNGVALAIVGRPNVGKSSLFNRLLEADRAIVTDIPGTTRDLVSETMELAGIPVRFVDTAGIRASDDRVESLGIERSRQAMADADLTLVVLDLSRDLDETDDELLAKAKDQGRHLIAGNKADLPRAIAGGVEDIAVSATTGEGIAALRERLAQQILPATDAQGGTFITSLRQQQLLLAMGEALTRARVAIAEHIPHEMLLLDLYEALRPLDAITGATTADDILNHIFSTFCIGK